MPVPMNTNDFLKGAMADVTLYSYVPNPAAAVAVASAGSPYVAYSISGATAFNMGACRDIGIAMEREIKLIEVDNSTWELDAYYVASKAEVKFTTVEAALRKVALAMGDSGIPMTGSAPPASFTTDVGVATNGTQYAIDEVQGSVNYYTVKIEVNGQSMKPGYTDFTGSPYSTAEYKRRIYWFWKCVVMSKVDMAFKRGEEVQIPFVAKPLLDNSVTYTRGATGRLGRITDLLTTAW